MATSVANAWSDKKFNSRGAIGTSKRGHDDPDVDGIDAYKLLPAILPLPIIKKRPCFNTNESIYVVSGSEMVAYFNLLEDPEINDFLNADSCLLCSDKYLLAMVFAYFKKASLSVNDYTRINFYVALFLANDMEEDEEDYKYEILPWAMGSDWRSRIGLFLQKRDPLWSRMSFRAVVSYTCCEEVMNVSPNHWAWLRVRSTHHSGTMRYYTREGESMEPRGPYESPRPICAECARTRANERVLMWCLTDSSSSDDNDDDDDDDNDDELFSYFDNLSSDTSAISARSTKSRNGASVVRAKVVTCRSRSERQSMENRKKCLVVRSSPSISED